MGKKYTEKNVYDAAIERINYILDHFKAIYLSVSGGKDSSVMLQLTLREAVKRNRKVDILYIDLEAQYKTTIEHLYELISLEGIGRIYWICLPISLRNASSILQPKWICWDSDVKHLWVRDMPDDPFVINEKNHPFKFFRKEMEFEEFILEFAKWYSDQFGMTACGVGIRANESFNRFRTIISETKQTFEGKQWTTQVHLNQKPLPVYNFYPLYDWRTEDIWACVFQKDLKYNHIYEMMFKNGVSIHEQRLCQPYGDDQREGIDQFKALEFETWEKVLNRVSGVNFSNIYARTSLLGHLKTEKPAWMSWEQYTVFLLESIRLYAPELEAHYYKKIKKFMKWWEENEGITVDKFLDEGTKDENGRNLPSFQRIARALEKNDFWMKRLSFSQTKSDVEELNRLREKYKKMIGDGKVGIDLLRWERGELNGN